VEDLAKTETGRNERSYAWREPGAAMSGAALPQLQPDFLHGVDGLLAPWNKGKLVISIESIQRSLAFEIPKYEVGMA